MPAVFIHGVPETHRVWDAIRSACGRADTIALALPGFGEPTPPRWSASKEDYADWIVGEISTIGTPVDLVGHDWGCLLAQRVASIRPDLIRTWACGGGPIDEAYVWHDTARAWQTPELGEQIMTMMTPDLLSAALSPELGETEARAMAMHVDDEMQRCILALYRSAITVGAEWQPAVDALGPARPAAVIWGRDDQYAPVAMGERLAARIGASLHVLDCGHFWPVVRPDDAASVLVELWARGED